MQERYAQFAADAADEDVQRVGVGVAVARVDVFEDFATADDGARLVHEVGEDAFFLRGEGEAAAVQVEARLQGVVAQAADVQGGVGVAAATA